MWISILGESEAAGNYLQDLMLKPLGTVTLIYVGIIENEDVRIKFNAAFADDAFVRAKF